MKKLMTILTAEDADDSYEELKKTVIARQRMREEVLSTPLLLTIDTITGTCQILAQDGTVLADAYLAMVDSTWYMWLSVDPLADKNISNSPYMYCNGNPVMLIDPDGMDWTWGNEEQTYVWLDVAKSIETTPQGYRYIGADNNSLLIDAGLNNQFQTLRGKRLGIGVTGGGDKNVGPFGNGIGGMSYALVSVTIGASVAISIGEPSPGNKSGSPNPSIINGGYLKMEQYLQSAVMLHPK